MSTGVMLTSITIRYSVVATAITYGTLFGLGTALAYTPPLGVAMRWFPKSKGLVNGIIVGGFGLGAFIFNQIQTAYLNPLNKELDEDNFFTDDSILNRVPSVFLMLGTIYSIVEVSENQHVLKCSLDGNEMRLSSSIKSIIKKYTINAVLCYAVLK